MMMCLLLILGFVLLIKGADWFVEGSSSIAKWLKVPSVVIGLTIVAMGTSAPEAAVSMTAALSGNNDIALSNVIGSNIFNLLVVVGVCAVIKVFAVDQSILARDFYVAIGATVLLLICMPDGTLGRLEGILLLAGMAAYLAATVREALKNRTSEDKETLMPIWKCLIFIVLGLACVIFGGDLVVDNACLIAAAWGLSETVIGLTIVAVGTSLPELVTSIVAAGKGDSGLALGNVVGSNIFNILFILGGSALLQPITVAPLSMVDGILSLVSTVIMFLWCRYRKEMGRGPGWISIAAYVAYTAYLLVR